MATDLLIALKYAECSAKTPDETVDALIVLRAALAATKGMTVKQLIAWAERGEHKLSAPKNIHEACAVAATESAKVGEVTTVYARRASLWLSAIIFVSAAIATFLRGNISGDDVIKAASPLLLIAVWTELCGLGLNTLWRKRAGK